MANSSCTTNETVADVAGLHGWRVRGTRAAAVTFFHFSQSLRNGFHGLAMLYSLIKAKQVHRKHIIHVLETAGVAPRQCAQLFSSLIKTKHVHHKHIIHVLETAGAAPRQCAQ
jgi:hypothetical protein